MWPFRRKSQADKAIAHMSEVVRISSERWKYFLSTMPFKNQVGLAEQISIFSFPMISGIRKAFPELEKSPDEVIYLFILKGIESSGTHTGDELETALGFQIPE